MDSKRKEEITKEIDRLEELMSDIVLNKKTDFVMKNKARLTKLRKLLREEK